MAYLRALEHRPKKHDYQLLRTDVAGQGIHHGLRFDYTIGDALHLFACGFFDDQIPGRGDADRPRVDIEDGLDADLGRRGRRRQRRGRRDDDDDEDMEDDEEDGGEDPEDEADRVIESLLTDYVRDTEGEQIMEKVQIIVTHMTRPPRDEKGIIIPDKDEEDAGCIVFFCVMDPIYSMGKAMSRLIKMCEEMHNFRMGMKATGMVDADSVPGNHTQSRLFLF
jgi:hypothetical protein